MTSTGTLEAQASTVTAVTQYILVTSAALQAQVSTVVGAAGVTPAITGSGILAAQASTVVGVSEREMDASGTLEAQVSTVADQGENKIVG